jgi:uncharacterized membrane protein
MTNTPQFPQQGGYDPNNPAGQPAPQPGYPPAAPPPAYGQPPAPYGQQPAPYGQPGQYNPQQDAEQNKLMGVLAYLGILVLIPMLAAPKDSRFAKYHTNQGLILLILGVGVSVIAGVLSMVAGLLGFAIISVLVWLLVVVLSLGILALAIIGIVHAVNGEEKPLPLIGGFTLIKA